MKDFFRRRKDFSWDRLDEWDGSYSTTVHRLLYGVGNSSLSAWRLHERENDYLLVQTDSDMEERYCTKISLEGHNDSLRDKKSLPNRLQTSLEDEDMEHVIIKLVGQNNISEETFYQVRWSGDDPTDDTLEGEANIPQQFTKRYWHPKKGTKPVSSKRQGRKAWNYGRGMNKNVVQQKCSKRGIQLNKLCFIESTRKKDQGDLVYNRRLAE